MLGGIYTQWSTESTSSGMDHWHVSDLHQFVKPFARGIGTAFDNNTRPQEANILTNQYLEANMIVKLVALNRYPWVKRFSISHPCNKCVILILVPHYPEKKETTTNEQKIITSVQNMLIFTHNLIIQSVLLK